MKVQDKLYIQNLLGLSKKGGLGILAKRTRVYKQNAINKGANKGSVYRFRKSKKK